MILWDKGTAEVGWVSCWSTDPVIASILRGVAEIERGEGVELTDADLDDEDDDENPEPRR